MHIDAGMRKWIESTARKNHWRVRKWMEVDDLIQEGYLCVIKCRKKYPHLAGRRDSRKHFMALVQTTFTRRLHDMSHPHDIQREVTFSDVLVARAADKDVYMIIDATWQSASTYSEGPFQAALAGAPPELRQLMQVLDSGQCAHEVHRRKSTRRSSVDGRRRVITRNPRVRYRETTNEHLCRLIGADPHVVDLLALAREHLG